MVEDITNIRLSAVASKYAERIQETNFFEDKITIAKFAMAYAIKNYYPNIDIDRINQESDASGLNYNVGSIDNDRFIFNLVQALYPESETPYRTTRALMIFGLEKLGEKIENDEFLPLSNLM